MGAEQSLQNVRTEQGGQNEDHGASSIVPGAGPAAGRERYSATAVHADPYGDPRRRTVLADDGGSAHALHAQSQVIAGTDTMTEASQALDGNRTTSRMRPQRSTQHRDKFRVMQAASRVEPSSQLGGSASGQEHYSGSKMMGAAGNLNAEEGPLSARGCGNVVARGGKSSGFNSQLSQHKRIGPNFGSGAYAQKQKVGVLEPTHHAADNVTGKNSDKLSQAPSRKSAGAFSTYKSNHVVRPGFANKPSRAKGYDQFQGKTTNVLEEMQYLVLDQIGSSQIIQGKQLQNLTRNFEESLKQVVYGRHGAMGDSQSTQHLRLEFADEEKSNDVASEQFLEMKSQSRQQMRSYLVQDAALAKNSPRSQQGRSLPHNGLAAGQALGPTGSHTTNPNLRLQPRHVGRSPFNLARKDADGAVTMTQETNQSRLLATVDPGRQPELKKTIDDLLKMDLTLVLLDESISSRSHSDGQISSFVIVEGQQYKKERFLSSKDLLAHLAESTQNRGGQFKLINSQNTQKYGASDKQVQAMISALNQRNYKLLETIINFQRNLGNSAEGAGTGGMSLAPPPNNQSSMAFSLDHSMDILPFSQSGSNNQTPLRKDNSYQHGVLLKQTEQRPHRFENHESLIIFPGFAEQNNQSRQNKASGQATTGSAQHSANNSILKNAGSPGGAREPQHTSSQPYQSQLKPKHANVGSHQGPALPASGRRNLGSAGAVIDRDPQLVREQPLPGQKVKTAQAAESAANPSSARFRSLQRAAQKRDACRTVNASSQQRDPSDRGSKPRDQKSIYSVNQAYEYERMVSKPMAQARKMLSAQQNDNGQVGLKRMPQTPPRGAVKLKDFQEDGKMPIRDGKVATMPQNTVNNISLLKSQDRQALSKSSSQAHYNSRPLTALNKTSGDQMMTNSSVEKTTSNRKNLQGPIPQPDVYYGDFEKNAANYSGDAELPIKIGVNQPNSQQKRNARQNIVNAPKDNNFRHKKKSATTDKKPLIGHFMQNAAKNNSQSRQSNPRSQQMARTNFIRKGGAAVSKPLLPGQRQQRIVGNVKATLGGPRKSQLRSQEPRAHASYQEAGPSDPDAQTNQIILQTSDGVSQPHSHQLVGDQDGSKSQPRADKQKIRAIQTVQVDFDADMPVEGRNGDEEANDSPGSMVFEKKDEAGEEATTRKDRDQYAEYLNDLCQPAQDEPKRAQGVANGEEAENSSHQNEQVMEQSMQKPVQSIQSLENLVRLRQRLDRDLSNQRDSGQSVLKNEQKNANKALEVIQQNMLRETASNNVSAPDGWNQATTPRQPLTLQEQFERDYQYPPAADQYRPIDLPDRVMLTLIQYLGMRNLVKFQKLSRHWYCKIQQVFNNMSQPMEGRFRTIYRDYFNFIKAKIVIGPTEFGHLKGIRIDRIMEIQLKEDSPDVLRNAGKTFKIENEFKYQDTDRNGNPSSGKFFATDKEQSRNGPGRQSQKSVVFRPQGRQVDYQKNQSLVYHNVYRFDIVKSRARPRSSWVHISDRMPGYSQNEIQVAPGDRILIGFCIYNLNGFVDLSSLQWAGPSFAKIHESMINFLNYSREEQIQRFTDRKQARGLKILCDIDRVCDVEDSVYDWYKYDLTGQRKPQTPIQMPIVIPPNLFEYFEVLDVWYNESDQHYNKKLLKAVKPSFDKRPGSTTNFNLILQFDERRRFSLSILPKESPIINEVRRRGVVTDRDKTEEEVQIRVGDLIMLYETKHIPQELQMITNLGE